MVNLTKGMSGVFVPYQSKISAPKNPRVIDSGEIPKITPSEFMKKMAMSTEERYKSTHEMQRPKIIKLLDMGTTTYQKFTDVDFNQCIFQPFPSEIIFQQYKPGTVVDVTLNLRNNDKVPRLVKVSCDFSPYFSITAIGNVAEKIASGMTSAFKVSFSPEENKDYSHELVVTTEREKFLVPIICIGSRALIDFPDIVSFDSCPVKHKSQKSLHVRNVGNRDAKFSISVDPPFDVIPNHGILPIGESQLIDVNFNPLTVRDYSNECVIHLDTGEKLYSKFYGTAVNVNVRLDKNTVLMEKTFISMATQRKVTIVNRSDVMVHFEWKKFENAAEDLRFNETRMTSLDTEKDKEKDKFLEECEVDPNMKERLAVLYRSFDNRRTHLQQDDVLFEHENFSIDPLSGDLFPHSEKEVAIIFQPNTVQVYTSHAYCDLTGRESRIPLRLKAEGMGPKINLSLTEINIGNVFMNSTHSFEVILINKGSIVAIYNIVENKSLFGQCFTFNPAEGLIEPDSYQAIHLTFVANALGVFVEDFFFAVDGTTEKLRLRIMGNIGGPSFQFNLSSLRFGLVSYGFPSTQRVTLRSQSEIPFPFELSVPSDGISEPMTGALNQQTPRNPASGPPREFEIYPSSGIIDAFAEIEIEVTLTSNSLKKYDTSLVVDVSSVGKDILSLPIHARCIVPQITAVNHVINFDRCFMRHPYENVVELENSRELATRYELMPQENPEAHPYKYFSSDPKGIIEGRSVIKVPLTIVINQTGHYSFPVLFKVFGSREDPLEVIIECIGEGPVMHISDSNLEFGPIPVLTNVFKIMTFSNESLITAHFNTDLHQENSVWNVEPTSGMVEAGCSTELRVTAYLDDSIRFRDRLYIHVEDSTDSVVELSAEGHGSTIITEPPIYPTLDIGPRFSERMFQFPFVIRNVGRRQQQISWQNLNYSKDSDSPSIFQLIPSRACLESGESVDAVLQGICNNPQVVSETLICNTIYNKRSGKNRVISAVVKAEFIQPLINLNTKQLFFCQDILPTNTIMKIERDLCLENVSALPIMAVASAPPPFYIVSENDNSFVHTLQVNVEKEDRHTFRVGFDPMIKDDLTSRKIKGDMHIVFKEHPHVETISLLGEVNFPNLTFDTQSIDFGCILNDTEVTQYIRMSNNGTLPASYKWEFINTSNEPLRFEKISFKMENLEKSPPCLAKIPDVVEDQSNGNHSNVLTPKSSRVSVGYSERDLPLESVMSNNPTEANFEVCEPPDKMVEIGPEEVFDFLPLYGTVQPGAEQMVTVTFFGHRLIDAKIEAKCCVDGGPDYLFQISGAASEICYQLSNDQIDFGQQMYDKITTSDFTIKNTGSVGVEFRCFGSESITSEEDIKRGVPIILPASGFIEAGQCQRLTLHLIPGEPARFHKSCQVQVAHLAPHTINVKGEGIFPRLLLDLPRKEDEDYNSLIKRARENLSGEKNDKFEGYSELYAILNSKAQEEAKSPEVSINETQLQMECERILVSEAANDIQTKRFTVKSKRVYLPEYVLDFGHVIMDEVRTQVVLATNVGLCPISFHVDQSQLINSGFSVEVDRVRNLPGAPLHDSVSFVIGFDPRSAGLDMGFKEATTVVDIRDGPCFKIRLMANVTQPNIIISNDVIDFGTVKVGMCKIVSIQFYNDTPVKTEWLHKLSQLSKRDDSPLLKKPTKPPVFEVLPNKGVLLPEQKVNVQVKFMPTDDTVFNTRLKIHLAQSSNRLHIHVNGNGQESGIAFSDEILKFDPILPHSAGTQKEVIVRNKCPFPVEFYNLEFDEQYKEEERILSLLKGYDEHNLLLTPPRDPGEKLPNEFLDFYIDKKAQFLQEVTQKDTSSNSPINDDLSLNDEVLSARSPLPREDDILSQTQRAEYFDNLDLASFRPRTETRNMGTGTLVGDIDVTPVSAALARHLEIDLTIEGRRARNRRGVAIIVHGSPRSGKTTTASAIADSLKGTVLVVDDVIKNAILSPTTPAGLRARDLCSQAAMGIVDEKPPELSGGLESSQATIYGISRTLPRGNPSQSNASKIKPTDTKPKLHSEKDDASSSAIDHVKIPINNPYNDDKLNSCILPEEIIVEILDDRMQSTDCFTCVIFDGLDSIFTNSLTSTALHILKAFNNRKYIFFVTIKLSSDDIAHREDLIRERIRKKEEEREMKERTILQELDEDEYDALTEDQKREVDRRQLKIKKERLLRERARQEEERKKKELEMILEQQRLDEEAKLKKNKRKGQDSAKFDKKKIPLAANTSIQGRLESRSDDKRRMSSIPAVKKSFADLKDGVDTEEDVFKPPTEDELRVQRRFKAFELTFKDICKVLDKWDRTKGTCMRPLTPRDSENIEHETVKKVSRGRKEREPLTHQEETLEEPDNRLKEAVGIPHLEIVPSDIEQFDRLGSHGTNFYEILQDMKILPSFEEVLEGIGQGSSGPPIPPPSLFSIVPFPQPRKFANKEEISQHYTFMSNNKEESNIQLNVEDVEEEVADEEKPEVTPADAKKDKKSKRSSELKPKSKSSKKKKEEKSDEEEPPLQSIKRDIEEEPMAKNPALLRNFRWVLPANGEVTIRLNFTSNRVGQFDQTFFFEILGTKRRYTLHCRGICTFPNISKEPRIVFPQRIKAAKKDAIISKKYIMANDCFEFGPLLCGKSRDRFRDGRYPENMETLTITNVSPSSAEVAFAFMNDVKAETFLFDPPSLCLEPEESQKLNIWAYPKQPGNFSDVLICCVKDNPELVSFKVQCQGVRPEIELDKKEFKFDKVLLHRKDTRTIYIKNICLQPISWKISGLETLGDDFTMSAEQGIIQPKQEYALNCHFRGLRPSNIKKVVRLEISDKEQIMGLVQLENLQIVAEAYDVALDISFPKGTDGGVEFGTVKVHDDSRQTISLKNKGKYECGFQFSLVPSKVLAEDPSNYFSILPTKGTLLPNDRPTTIQLTFKSNREVLLKDDNILKCNIIEPNLGNAGETIACIPIKLSVKAVFSRFSILPKGDIDFGALMINQRKQLQFAIENKGDFDFKYTIARLTTDDVAGPTKGTKTDLRVGKSPEGASSAGGRSFANKSSYSRNMRGTEVQQNQGGLMGTKLVLGNFTVNPAFGSVLPRAQQIVHVECFSDQVGRQEEVILIDVSDRNMSEYPDGFLHRLMAEAIIPGINSNDIASIFEEHVICKNLGLFMKTNKCNVAQGIYAEDEKRFMFSNVVVGKGYRARLKFTNPYRVKCEVTFSTRTHSSQSSGKKTQEVYDVDISKAIIPPHSFVYCTISFNPITMQTYTGTFEAVVEGLPSSVSSKVKPFQCELIGDGNLPRISVVRPSLRNRAGSPLLLFRRLLVGEKQVLKLVLRNDGSLRSTVFVNLFDENKAYSMELISSAKFVPQEQEYLSEYEPWGDRSAHDYSLIVDPEEEVVFNVTISVSEAQEYEGYIRLTIVDNAYEETRIELIGEGYMDDITIENIHGFTLAEEILRNNERDDNRCLDVSNHLQFGELFVGKQRQLVFSLVNHSETDCIKFAWPTDHPQVTFVPTVGHLHHGCTKDITTTFISNKATSLEMTSLPVKICKIEFTSPSDQVPDWDDRQKVVRWVDAATLLKSASTIKEEPPKPAKGSVKQKPVPMEKSSICETEVIRPRRRKITESKPEPECSVIVGTEREIPLMISALVAYSKYKCKVEQLNFRDTPMFQTRVHEFGIANKGTVYIKYKWHIEMENGGEVHFSFEDTLSARPESRLSVLGIEGGAEPETPEVPFLIDPCEGTISVGDKATFAVRFMPLEIGTFSGRLVCTIPNLDAEDSQRRLEIPITGTSHLPQCYFDVEDSDYLTANRRDPTLKGPGGCPPGALNPSTRVIEFFSNGVNCTITKIFNAINPTTENYSFTWICEDPVTVKKKPHFVPTVWKGKLIAGKKCTIGFKFVACDIGLIESFWRFSIPSINMNVPFLLVGESHEPSVFFSRSHVNFRNVIVGTQATEVVQLINNEDKPMNFVFDYDSVYSDGRQAVIGVMPNNGVIGPLSRLDIDLFFNPPKEKEHNFNLICKIQYKTVPLHLNVKAEGFCMNAQLLCDNSQQRHVELTHEGLNEINLRNLDLNERVIRNFYLTNIGKYTFSYKWEILNDPNEFVALEPISGILASDGKEIVEMIVCANRKFNLKGIQLKLDVEHGPKYLINLEGKCSAPGIHLSSHKIDFGKAFIYRGGSVYESRILTITNRDSKPISVQCLYESTSFLKLIYESQLLQPGKSAQATLEFYPDEVKKYNERIEFEINGISRTHLDVVGEGIILKVELANGQKKVSFGCTRVMNTTRREVVIVNRSMAEITGELVLSPSSLAISQLSDFLTITPELFTLKPRQKLPISLTICPRHRLPKFSEEIFFESSAMSMPVFYVTGTCIDLDIVLDTETVPFGAVVLNGKCTRQILMINKGDIGAHFTWEKQKFAPDFTIFPTKGYVPPLAQVSFEITFHPSNVNPDIRYPGLKCNVEGIKHPLLLTLSGICSPCPSSGKEDAKSEIVNFSSIVRETERKTITISNRTAGVWRLRPVVEGEHWACAEGLTVEQGTSKPFEIIYRPLTMSAEGKKHIGSLFFALPDGTGIMYTLQGIADAPKAIDFITREVPCKTTYSEMLHIYNWLKQTQRFKVFIEMIKPEKIDGATRITGLDYIDVPGLGKRDYKLTFFSHKEGQYQARVVFQLPSGEYEFYVITFRATPPGVINVININTPARNAASYAIPLSNPLSHSVNFNTATTSPDILMPPNFNIPAESEAQFLFEYLPLKVGTSQAKLSLTSNDLGVFTYDLQLESTPARPEKTAYCRTGLGTSQTVQVTFTNYAKTKSEYLCKVIQPDRGDKVDFIVEKSLTAAPSSSGGSELSIDIIYEPCQLGDSRATLQVSSVVGGEYNFPLVGTCFPPKPQGPVLIKAGATVSIPFKNIFYTTTNFSYMVDDSCFVVKGHESLKPKKSANIHVEYKPQPSTSTSDFTKVPTMGKLIVTSLRSGSGHQLSWTYYLKGYIP